MRRLNLEYSPKSPSVKPDFGMQVSGIERLLKRNEKDLAKAKTQNLINTARAVQKNADA